MRKKGGTLSITYQFECPKCGIYTVDQQTFESVITPSLKERLDEQIRTGDVIRAIVRFEENCLRCTPNGEYKVTLEIERVTDHS